MRPIDADALIDFLDVGHLRHPSELCFSEVDVANLLLHAPTISPDEVRGFGKWEKETICYSRCSNCKKLIQTAELVEYKALDEQGGFCVIPSIEKYDINYCPNCGARLGNGGTDDS